MEIIGDRKVLCNKTPFNCTKLLFKIAEKESKVPLLIVEHLVSLITRYFQRQN